MDSTRSGLRQQPVLRLGLRVLGSLALGAGLVLLVIAGLDFFNSLTGDEFGRTPTKFWMFFVGLPLLVVGSWALSAGFLGAGSRYVASEVAPGVRDSMDYLGVGRGPAGRDTRSCRICQASADADAKFCDHCGTALTGTAG